MTSLYSSLWAFSRKTPLIVIAAFSALLTISLSACAEPDIDELNDLILTEFTVEGDRLMMDGPINSQTYAQFKDVMAANPRIATLVLLDVPGSVDDDTMIRLGYDIRRRGLNTHLEADSVAHSGGVDLFLAGVERTMERGAVLGVHSWYDGVRDGADYPRNAPEHDANRGYIEDMIGDDAFYWFTLEAAPADDIHEMSTEEVLRFGLLTAPIQ